MQATKPPREFKPVWWTVQHTTIWEQYQPLLRADFQQLRATTERDRAVHQQPDQPVFQQHAVTPRNVDVERAYDVPDNDWEVGTSWEQIEPAVRYGVGARAQYPEYQRWSGELETLLRTEWEGTNPPGPWEKMKRAVRHGFERKPPN